MKETTQNEAAHTIEALIKDLASKNGQTREAARKALVAIGRPAVASLLSLLDNSNHQVRWEAAKTLGEIKDPAAIDGLLQALIDVQFDVRWLAAEGLVALGTQAVIPLLQTLSKMQEEDSGFLRDGAHHVLHAITGDLQDAIKPVLAALEDANFSVKTPNAARDILKSFVEHT